MYPFRKVSTDSNSLFVWKSAQNRQYDRCPNANMLLHCHCIRWCTIGINFKLVLVDSVSIFMQMKMITVHCIFVFFDGGREKKRNTYKNDRIIRMIDSIQSMIEIRNVVLPIEGWYTLIVASSFPHWYLSIWHCLSILLEFN